MKIAVDVTPVLPGGTCGGIKQLILELLKGFGENPAGDSFLLLTAHYNRDTFRQYEQYGMKQLCVLQEPPEGKSRLLSSVLNKMIRGTLNQYLHRGMLKENGVDVLFCPMAAPLYHEPGIPTVSVICDLQHMYHPYFFTRQELAHRNDFYEQLKKKVDYIICISSHTRQCVIEKLGVADDRTVAIPICVQSRLQKPAERVMHEILNKFNLNNKRYCFYPANLWKHKNHKMLLVAFNMLIRNYQQHDIHLVFTGDSLTGNTISACVKQMGLAGMVHFLGYVRDEELAAVWHNAYFLIFPSLFEGFGIPLVEALMYGKPILASNATSIPEVAGDAALYFDPRKPDEIAAVLHTIISDEGRCRELVERGRKQLQNYSFSSMLERYRSVLYRAAEKGCRADCTEVFGIFDDCWAGPSIEIVLGSSKSRRMLEMRGFIPDWHPSSKMKISFSAGRRYTLRKHEELVIREYFPGEAGNAHIDVSGGFVPGNGDPRTLTFMVKQAFIIDEATGKKIYELRGRPA